MRHKRLMSVCRRSLLRNSTTDDDNDGSNSTADGAQCSCKRDAAALTEIRHPSRRLIYSENYTGDTGKIYSWSIVQTKMLNKIHISRHFKIKF